ncbi:MAG: hypothetical protein ABIP55_07685 [Tepidisphaeraceae bacterium]
MIRTIACIVALLTTLALTGCAPNRAGPAQFSSVARDRQSLFEHLDGEVAVVGKAENHSSRGVAVVLDDGTVVGVSELEQWRKKVRGKTVTVTGKLRRLATPDPASSAGTARELFLIEGARWRVGDKPPQDVRVR